MKDGQELKFAGVGVGLMCCILGFIGSLVFGHAMIFKELPSDEYFSFLKLTFLCVFTTFFGIWLFRYSMRQ